MQGGIDVRNFYAIYAIFRFPPAIPPLLNSGRQNIHSRRWPSIQNQPKILYILPIQRQFEDI